MRSMRREESGGSQRTVRERAARIVASMPGPKPPNQTGQKDWDRASPAIAERGRLTSRPFTYSRSNAISTGGVATSAA